MPRKVVLKQDAIRKELFSDHREEYGRFLEEFPDPRTTGRLYGVNTLGSVVGSLAAAWTLLPAFGFARSAWLLGGIVLALGIALPRARARLPGVVLGAIALAIAISQS